MSEMIERVARAILGAATTSASPERRAAYIEKHWRSHVPGARAAIEAMIEPTDEQMRALERSDIAWRDQNSRNVWMTMARGALDPPQHPSLAEPVLLSDGQVVEWAVYERMKAMFDALGVRPVLPRAIQAQLETLAQALGAAKAQIAALQQDRSHEARKLEIDAFEAETNRLKALRP